MFTVNTKRLTGRVVVYQRMVYVNGHKRGVFYPRAVAEGRRVTQRLESATDVSVRVFPLLVFVGDHPQIKAQPSDVYALHVSDLVPWLRSLNPCLGPEQLRSLDRAARRGSTWSDT